MAVLRRCRSCTRTRVGRAAAGGVEQNQGELANFNGQLSRRRVAGKLGAPPDHQAMDHRGGELRIDVVSVVADLHPDAKRLLYELPARIHHLRVGRAQLAVGQSSLEHLEDETGARIVWAEKLILEIRHNAASPGVLLWVVPNSTDFTGWGKRWPLLLAVLEVDSDNASHQRSGTCLAQ